MSTIARLSLVVNTRNAGATLAACLQSAKALVEEIIVMDMESDDDTPAIAKAHGATLLRHPNVGYVEPARNAALAAAHGDWILLLDADEELHGDLAARIPDLIADTEVDAYYLPRQNIIFGRPVRSGWWPDYQLRLFRAGTVDWPTTIHGRPTVRGKTRELPPEASNSIIHHNYDTLDAYIDRAQRYSAIESATEAPLPAHFFAPFLDELIRRYYHWDAWHDGRHGQALALLQGWQAALVALRRWEAHDFSEGDAMGPALSRLLTHAAADARYWEARARWEKASVRTRWYWQLRMRWKI